MDVPDFTTHQIAPYPVRENQLVTAQSYMIDRFVPDCEIVALLPKEVAGGQLTFGPGAFKPPAASKGLKARLRSSRRMRRQVSGPVFDFRLRTPQNWAHFLNNHLPLFFMISDALALDWAACQIILPAQTPRYIRKAAEIFGLPLIMTDDVLEGDGILFEVDPWTALRPQRATWAASERVMRAVRQLQGADLPKRVFLARRDTRVIANQAEVEGFLGPLGFITLYPEDLSAADQVRLFHHAEVIVAVHGAGLAPLLYRQADSALTQLIEIMPVGHMTDVYRVMAQQVGCAWIGVRGRLKPEHIAPAYRLEDPFKAFSLEPFDVDLRALQVACELAEYSF